MKALIYCKSANTDWVTKNFNSHSPYMLQVVNKPLLEYYIDFCSLKKVKEIRIVAANDDGSISRYFGDGGKWGIDISYSLAKDEDTIKNVYTKNKGFCKQGELVVIEGFGFIDYNKAVEDYPFFEENSSACLRDENFAVYYITEEQAETKIDWDAIPEIQNAGFDVTEIKEIRTFYDLSRDIIGNKSDHFVLPGYSNEKDVFIGQNVEIAKSCRIEKPVMIGSNVQLKNSVSIGKNTIIGDNVIVDSDATLSGSIIYGKSYVGRAVEIINKIVYKNCLISPDTGDAIEIVDSFLTSKLDEGPALRALRFTVHYTAVILMIIVMIIPTFIVTALMLATGAKNKQGSYIVSKGFRTIRLREYLPGKNVFVNLARRFSLDKFGLLVEALKGNIHLAGNTVYADTPENRKFIENLPFYKPGVFSYTESIGVEADDFQCRINDSYYVQNYSVFLDMKIIFTSILNRLLG